MKKIYNNAKNKIIDMAIEFITREEFKFAMVNIDQRFEELEKRIDAKIEAAMEKQRIHFENEMKRFIGVILEEVDARFKALYEHPVFADYEKRQALLRDNNKKSSDI